MSKLLRDIFSVSLLISCLSVSAQYKISGRLNNYDSLWINSITLAALNSTGQLHYASPDIIINKDSMDKEGNFSITGNSLPDEDRIYRLDLTNQKNRVMLQNGPTSNSIYLILNNHSSVKISCNNFSKASYNYQVEGSAENSALQRLMQYSHSLDNLFTSPSQNNMVKEMAQDKFNSSLRNYCDTNKYPLVAIVGISDIMDFNKDYAAHSSFYKQFLDKLKKSADSGSIYVKEFEKKLDLLDYQNKPTATTSGNSISIWVYMEGVIILILLGFILYQRNKKKQVNGSAQQSEPDRSALFETLTRREKEILSLLIEDIQNKEIASKLNLEVSTIKTHISKIYQKLAIKNRNEVKAYESFLKNKVE